MPQKPIEKITAFVTHSTASGPELLLFQHPTAGIQLPAGTVEAGESLEQAALRETAEEIGLSQLRLVQYIGWRDEMPPDHTHVMIATARVYARPDPSSAAWAEVHRGYPVRQLRRQNGFVQVVNTEHDRFPNPNYVSYQIAGWVPEDSLAEGQRRYFFHLALDGAAPDVHSPGDGWTTRTDNHTFRPFWAPLNNLPEILPFQRGWLDYVREELGYGFDEVS
jgi:8-oxo-dGTP pyrophosphatase MutT (NUDIX family)